MDTRAMIYGHYTGDLDIFIMKPGFSKSLESKLSLRPLEIPSQCLQQEKHPHQSPWVTRMYIHPSIDQEN